MLPKGPHKACSMRSTPRARLSRAGRYQARIKEIGSISDYGTPAQYTPS